MSINDAAGWGLGVGSSAFSAWLETLEFEYATAIWIGCTLQILASLIGFWNSLSACLLKSRSKGYKIPTAVWSQVYAHLIVLSALLVLSYRSVWTFDCRHTPLDILRLVSEGFWLITLLCCLLIQHVEIQQGPRLSTFFFWLVGAASLSSPAYVAFVNREGLAWNYDFSICTAFFLSVCMLLWEGLRARTPRPHGPNAKDDLATSSEKEDEVPLADEASIFSWLGCHWIWPLLKKGRKEILRSEDWPCIKKDAKSQYASSEFEELWDEESAKTQPSLMRVLAILIWKELVISGLFYATGTIVMAAASPVAMYLFILFLEQRQVDAQVPILSGTLLASSIALSPFLEIIFKSAGRSVVRNASIKMESAIINVLYRRIFNRNSAVQVRQPGDVINQISSDIATIDTFMYTADNAIHDVWVMPFLLATYIYFLTKLIGVYALIPLLILGFTMYGATLFGTYAANIQSRSVIGRGERSKLEIDMLHSIRAIKLGSWGHSFQEKLLSGRETNEIPFCVRYLYLDSISLGILEHLPVIITVITLGCFALWSGHVLAPEIAFPVWSMLSSLELPMQDFRRWMVCYNDALQATGRIQGMYLDAEDDRNTFPEDGRLNMGQVRIEDGSFGYQAGTKVLTDIEFETMTGKFYAIVGRVGSGKSTLCKAILGEIRPTQGRVRKSGSVAYAAQKPWIFSNTVRENILFGSRWDAALYALTIKACALESDLAFMPDGDNSYVGEEGLQLSGGQKARISLARAIYAQADLYIIDDVLAAVDQHTANHIIREVLGSEGILKDKTTILVSNHVPAILAADHVTLIENGTIVESSKQSQIGKLSKIERFLTQAKEMETSHSTDADGLATVIDASAGEGDTALLSDTIRLEQGPQLVGSPASFRRFTQDMGVIEVIIYLMLMAIAFLPFFLAPIWLQYWTARNVAIGNNGRVDIWTAIGAALYLLGAVVLSIQLITFVTIRNKASMKLYKDMVVALVRSPMSFFETVNTGQIINRLSGDFYNIDVQLHYCANMMNAGWMLSLQILIYIAIIKPVLIPALLILVPICINIGKYSFSTASQLKRSESDTRSVIYGQIKESSDGIETIRAYGKSNYFSRVFKHKVDLHMQTVYAVFTCNIWMYIQVNSLACLFALIIPLIAVWRLYQHKEISTTGVAASIAIVLQLAVMVRQAVDRTCDFATRLIALDRCFEYADLPSEKDEPTYEPKPSWPQEGRIVFKDFGLRYRPELSFALQNINLTIKPNQKIGFVGRTGAGKSSFIMALFRIVNAAQGQILIDGVDISTISLSRLRESLAIIPQDAALFKGSIRYNLDFEEQYQDEELWEVLERCQLRPYVESLPEGLNAEVGEGGSKFSYGQRQLMSIARTFLNRSKILVLDEATASVDSETDALIQKGIREISKSRSVLTIAHRINTVLDSNVIVVLQEGQIAEQGSPQELLKKKGLFYGLAKEVKVVD